MPIHWLQGAQKASEGTGSLQFKRQGKGSHEIYRTEDGKSVTLYYDNGDVPKGTLSSILKQAGVNMSVHDFLRS